MLDVGSEDSHIRKTTIISHLPSLPQDLLHASWELNRARSQHLGARQLGAGIALAWFSPHPPSSAKEMCHRCQLRAGPGTHILALIRATLGSAPAKGSSASPPR